MGDSTHNNHRERTLQKFQEHGLRVFQDHEVLELLLFYAIPRADTNKTAHLLMQQFGSLHAVFEAAPEQLQAVEGVGQRSAALIRLVQSIGSRCRADRLSASRCDCLTTYERVAAYFMPQLCEESQEVLLAAYVDGAGRVLKCEECGRGSQNEVPLDLNRIARSALLCGAAGVALAHNHPNGVAVPSETDLRATDRIERVLTELQIQLLDHCIVAGEQTCSIGRLRRPFGGKRR